MDNYSDYSQQPRQHWPPHLLQQQQQSHPPPASDHGYPAFYQQKLSLNLSSLSVASPTNLSPINPPPPAATALSPVTPISPSNNSPFQHHHHHHHPFSFDEHGMLAGSSTPYEPIKRPPPPSRSSSTGAQLPRKRSFTANPSLNSPASTSQTPLTTTLVEESMYDDEARDAPMELASAASYDEMEVRTAYGPSPGSAGGGSPVDGSGSTSGAEDSFGMMGMGGTMNILGKPLATNNFVTKLYQMINDPKSAQFIAWTELGTSFVVSNVGEFSRSILGSHFKHNNFSSFVRQLNMYGFHKINRTPRAQRTSTDAQTWEFSHHKFLRGRPDLLDEIKRKALEPDPGMKHRVELPGEVASQLNAMRDENRRVWDQLAAEKRKVEKLVNVVGRLWDVVGKAFPGSVPQFPSDLLESAESPNIYITSPTSTSRYPPPLSMNMHANMHGLNSNSPNSSPTAADFPAHVHHSHSQQQQQQQHGGHPLSRQQSFQHGYRADSSSSMPLSSSPGSISMDLFDDGSHDPPPSSGRKRPRLDDTSPSQSQSSSGSTASGGVNGLKLSMNGLGGGGNDLASSSSPMSMLSSVSSPGSAGPNSAGQGQGQGQGQGIQSLTVPKKSSRARSDSAPMGYVSHGGALSSLPSWSGSSLVAAGGGPHGGVLGRPRSGSGMMPRGIPNIGNMTRGANASTPLLSITTAESGMNSR